MKLYELLAQACPNISPHYIAKLAAKDREAEEARRRVTVLAEIMQQYNRSPRFYKPRLRVYAILGDT